MKCFTLVIAFVALIIAGDAFLQSKAVAGQGKKIISIQATYSVEKVQPPSLLAKLFCCTERTCKPNVVCTASSPGEVAEVLCTAVSAVQKGVRTAALSGVKFAAKSVSRFVDNMMLIGRVVTSI